VNIRDTIVAKRRKRIAYEGHALGVHLPAERVVPVISFGRPPGVICEVKRRSPSKGDIAIGLDPVKQVSCYVDEGITSVSVLTEEDHFAGSLSDLIKIKQIYPKLSVLRKDFLIDCEDIDISYRAGADAVLLIASMLDGSTLQKMHARATELGLTALVELHDDEDVEKARSFSPQLVGINSRNLETFAVDAIHPIALKAKIGWQTKVVYESGIRGEEDARLAAVSGFDLLLVGEAVVRKPELIKEIIKGTQLPGGAFWADLFARSSGGPPALRRSLIKICGLTNGADVDSAISAGADALGFIFARSPRRASQKFVRSLGVRRSGEPVRIGVVVSTDPLDPGTEAFDLVQAGFLDAIQFHGDEEPGECYKKAYPYYKAFNPSDTPQVDRIRSYHSPRVLIDAHVPGKIGGTGVRISSEIVTAAKEIGPLWLAGGLNPDNIAGVVRRFSPELVDVSTGVEQSAGIKDHSRVNKFIEHVRTACEGV
jgi:indole-3-glycerol phosphate synthase/phosphoribosylanthranilate isomerase